MYKYVPNKQVSMLGMPDNIHNWLVSFITGRQQKCKANGSCSSSTTITRGVIQGSDVGPIPFTLS